MVAAAAVMLLVAILSSSGRAARTMHPAQRAVSHLRGPHAAAPRLLAQDTECSRALSGGGSYDGIVEEIAEEAASHQAYIGGIAFVIEAIFTFVKPDKHASGKSIYDCISGFVNEEVSEAIDAHDLSVVNKKVDQVVKAYRNFTARLDKLGNGALSPAEQDSIKRDYDKIGIWTEELGHFLFNESRNPTGVLTTAVTFATVQYFPYYSMLYNEHELITGAPANQSADTLQVIKDRMIEDVQTFQAFVNATSAPLLGQRLEKISGITYLETGNPKKDAKQYSAEFHDGGSKWALHWWQTDEYGGFADKAALDSQAASFRRVVVSHVQTAFEINQFQATGSLAALWPHLVPGSPAPEYQVIVREQLCFSLTQAGDLCASSMPPDHDYQSYNISSIELRSGDHIDYIKITYQSNDPDKAELVQQFGNSAGGTYHKIENLTADPIVKAVWCSDDKLEWDGKQSDYPFTTLGYLRGVGLTQASGLAHRFAALGSGMREWTDDFSLWGGDVWLCGLNVATIPGMVTGLGPIWCYTRIV